MSKLKLKRKKPGRLSAQDNAFGYTFEVKNNIRMLDGVPMPQRMPDGYYWTYGSPGGMNYCHGPFTEFHAAGLDMAKRFHLLPSCLTLGTELLPPLLHFRQIGFALIDDMRFFVERFLRTCQIRGEAFRGSFQMHDRVRQTRIAGQFFCGLLGFGYCLGK